MFVPRGARLGGLSTSLVRALATAFHYRIARAIRSLRPGFDSASEALRVNWETRVPRWCRCIEPLGDAT